MWSDDYNECDRLFSEVLRVLCHAHKMNLAKPLSRRLNESAGDKMADFNKLCLKLIRRYGKK